MRGQGEASPRVEGVVPRVLQRGEDVARRPQTRRPSAQSAAPWVDEPLSASCVSAGLAESLRVKDAS